MKIKHVNGTFWDENNNCFGPECRSTKYNNLNSMPKLIGKKDSNILELWIIGNEANYYSSSCRWRNPYGDYVVAKVEE